MNIVNFQFIANGFDDQKLIDRYGDILMRLQKRVIAAPSFTEFCGRFSVQVAICNRSSLRLNFKVGQEIVVQES